MCSTLRSAPPFSTPLRPTRPTVHPGGPGSARGAASYQMIGTSRREEAPPGVEAVEKKTPRPLHQYCSLTWRKQTPASMFHHVIGREDQMPWLDTPTLLPAQTMTQSSLHYSRLSLKEEKFERDWKAEDVLESNYQQVGHVRPRMKTLKQKRERELLPVQQAGAIDPERSDLRVCLKLNILRIHRNKT